MRSRSDGFRASRDRNGELARCAVLRHVLFERPELFAIARGQPDVRLNILLPAPVQEQPLLRFEAEVTLVPAALVVQNAQFAKQLAHQFRALVGNRHVVRRPWVCGDVVLAPARIPAGLPLHFQQTKSRKPFRSSHHAALRPAMPPPTITTGVRTCREGAVNGVPSRMWCPSPNASLTKEPGDPALPLGGESNQRGRQNRSPGRLHLSAQCPSSRARNSAPAPGCSDGSARPPPAACRSGR